MAKLQMLADTGISNGAYGLASGMFFIGYFIFEVPSNLILQRVAHGFGSPASWSPGA